MGKPPETTHFARRWRKTATCGFANDAQAARVDSLAIEAGGLRTKERVGFKTGVFGVVEPAKTIREDDVTVRISLCEGILPEASSECAALGGERIPSTHHPQPHWNSTCCSEISNRASWNRCRPRSIPLMLVNWLGAKTHLGYAEGHLISPQHGRKLSCTTAAGMCGLRSQ